MARIGSAPEIQDEEEDEIDELKDQVQNLATNQKSVTSMLDKASFMEGQDKKSNVGEVALESGGVEVASSSSTERKPVRIYCNLGIYTNLNRYSRQNASVVSQSLLIVQISLVTRYFLGQTMVYMLAKLKVRNFYFLPG